MFHFSDFGVIFYTFCISLQIYHKYPQFAYVWIAFHENLNIYTFVWNSSAETFKNFQYSKLFDLFRFETVWKLYNVTSKKKKGPLARINFLFNISRAIFKKKKNCSHYNNTFVLLTISSSISIKFVFTLCNVTRTILPIKETSAHHHKPEERSSQQYNFIFHRCSLTHAR